MPEHIQYEDDDLFNPETHHESSDVPVRPLFWFIVIFIVFAVVSHFALWFLYKGFVKGERSRMDPPQTAIERPKDASVPQNQPLLQPFPQGNTLPNQSTPVSDMADMRAAEDLVLKNYAWVDKERGVVRIPIDRAKELMAARLATQSSPAPASNVVPPSGPPASSPAEQAPSPAPVSTTTGGSHR